MKRRSINFAATLVVIASMLAAQGPAALAADAASVMEPEAAAQRAGKISLDLKGMDIVEVIKMLAAKGGMNVVIGAGVKGKVTIFLNNVDIMDALDIVLVSNDMAYEEQGDIIYVMPQQEYEARYGLRFADRKAIKVFVLKYAKASEAMKAISQMKSKIGKVVLDEGSNSIIVVDSPAAIAQIEAAVSKMDLQTETHIYELKYATASEIKTKLTDRITPAIGAIQIDERTNKVAVTDSPWKLGLIDSLVKAFDAKPQQVLIDAKIVQITLNDQFKMGVDWDAFIKKLNKELEVRSIFELVPKNMLNPGLQIALGTIGAGQDFAMVVQMLQTMGDANLLSSPRITALNNQEAKILVGTSQPYATSSVTQNTGTSTTATSLTFIDVGVKLYVTPTINMDNFITMKIRPEVSAVSDNYTYYVSGATMPTTVPIVSTTQAETTVTVKDGTTIIIGGLVKDERSSKVDEIPLLGNIPMVGMLFRKTEDKVIKTEIVVFITTRIISGEKDYIEQKPTPPTGDERFTMPEKPAFYRRNRVQMDPSFFKKSPAEKFKDKVDLEERKERRAMDEAMSKSTESEYNYVIKTTIVGNICLPRGKKAQLLKGYVKTAFTVSPRGDLVGEPEVVQSSNCDLDKIAVSAVRKSAPFPAFPAAMGNQNKRFAVDVLFE
jgi:MSHA biogenesis protein MshL